jgi:ribosome biogenesis GTPase
MTKCRVIWENRGFCRVATNAGEVLLKVPSHWVDRPVTGDWVMLDDQGEFAELCPRQNTLSRKRAGRESLEQVLAANIDVAMLVAGLDGDFNIRRLERYLVLAEHCKAAPVVVLNKSDLCENPLAAVAEVDAITRGVVPVALISALNGDSVHALHRYVEPGQTAVLLGSSGAGKSTIVNALLGTAIQPTFEVRKGDARGRHTTTSRHLFGLEAGWFLIDTPGIRELEPWAGPESAVVVFDDIAEVARNCRFGDCSHHEEPDCAVNAAISAGTLDPSRLESFRKITGELRHLEVKQDVRAALEQKRRWRNVHKAMRKTPDKRK